jgi:hypothetical protein
MAEVTSISRKSHLPVNMMSRQYIICTLILLRNVVISHRKVIDINPFFSSNCYCTEYICSKRLKQPAVNNPPVSGLHI